METQRKVQCRCWVNSRAQRVSECRANWLRTRAAPSMGKHETKKAETFGEAYRNRWRERKTDRINKTRKPNEIEQGVKYEEKR